jgi:hypothetical protein
MQLIIDGHVAAKFYKNRTIGELANCSAILVLVFSFFLHHAHRQRFGLGTLIFWAKDVFFAAVVNTPSPCRKISKERQLVVEKRCPLKI